MDLGDKVGFGDVCPGCSAWLHSCTHCASLRNGGCAEPQAERPRDPAGRNFCEWFRPGGDGGMGGRRVSGGRAQAEAMWKKLTNKDGA